MRSSPSSSRRDGLRLAVGTLTVYPVSPPRMVDRRAGGSAMAFAPLVGVLLALPVWLLATTLADRWSPLLLAAACVALLTVLSRALHLDGLADTADGLGSRRPRQAALEIMQRGDIGPFGVAALLLTLLLQVTAAAQVLAGQDGPILVACAVLTSRLVLPVVCAWFPAARADGLGAVVAGAVGWPQLVTSAVFGLVALAAAAVTTGTVGPVALGTAGVLVGTAFCWWCVRRLGGVTGDVLGACVEVTFAAALLLMALG
jgi:adenosylcobinamide-GDP ribazoletransferase